MGRHVEVRDIEKEAQAVLLLQDTLKELGVSDPDLIDISIGSETNFKEAVEELLKLEGETAGLRAGLETYINTLADRVKRFKAREDWCRTMVTVALKQANQPRLETGYGTVSLKGLPAKLVVHEEADIPADFWIEPPPAPPPEPVINKAGILERLKAREAALTEANAIEDTKAREKALKKVNKEFPVIPGVTLSESNYTIQIRRK